MDVKYIDYNARMKVSKSGKVQLRIYERPIRKKISSKQESKKNSVHIPKKRNIKSSNHIAKCSSYRTRSSLLDLVDNNLTDFKSFITLTFKDEIDDYSVACDYLKKYINKIKYHLKKNGDTLKYLAVIEVQEARKRRSGKGVFHFHILTNLEIGSFFLPKRAPKKFYSYIKNRKMFIDCYDLRYWSHGYSSACELSKESKSHYIALYLSKYFIKSGAKELYGKRKYFCSKNLDRSIVTYLNDETEITDIYNSLSPYLDNTYMSNINNSCINPFIECEFYIE